MRLDRTKNLGAEIINFDDEDPVGIIKKETNEKGATCIDAVGFEAVGHLAGNGGHIHNITSNGSNNDGGVGGKKSNNNLHHDHSIASNPQYNPVNPLQVITWMAQVAKKYSTISISGVYSSGYDQFLLGLLFNLNIQIHMGQCPVKNIMNNCSILLKQDG